MNTRPAETCDDFSKMKNLWHVNQNPEDEESRMGKGEERVWKRRIHFMFLHRRCTFSKLCRLVYSRSCAVECRDGNWRRWVMAEISDASLLVHRAANTTEQNLHQTWGEFRAKWHPEP